MHKMHKIIGISYSAVTADNVHFPNVNVILTGALWFGHATRLFI